MKFQKVLEWVVDNRRAIGTICGSLLIVFGYVEEGGRINHISTLL